MSIPNTTIKRDRRPPVIFSVVPLARGDDDKPIVRIPSAAEIRDGLQLSPSEERQRLFLPWIATWGINNSTGNRKIVKTPITGDIWHAGKPPHSPCVMADGYTRAARSLESAIAAASDLARLFGPHFGIGANCDALQALAQPRLILDHDGAVSPDGTISAQLACLESHASTWRELSPSGIGAHSIYGVAGEIPERLRHRVTIDDFHGSKLEVLGRGFCTLTGIAGPFEKRVIQSAPAWLLDQLVTAAVEQKERHRSRSESERAERVAKRAALGYSSNPSQSYSFGVDVGSGGIHYGRAALAAECDRVASTPEGGRNNQLNASAFAIAQLVAGGELEVHEAESALLDAARLCGLDSAEAKSAIDSGFTVGLRKPRSRTGGVSTCDPGILALSDAERNRLAAMLIRSSTIPIPPLQERQKSSKTGESRKPAEAELRPATLAPSIRQLQEELSELRHHIAYSATVKSLTAELEQLSNLPIPLSVNERRRIANSITATKALREAEASGEMVPFIAGACQHKIPLVLHNRGRGLIRVAEVDCGGWPCSHCRLKLAAKWKFHLEGCIKRHQVLYYGEVSEANEYKTRRRKGEEKLEPIYPAWDRAYKAMARSARKNNRTLDYRRIHVPGHLYVLSTEPFTTIDGAEAKELTADQAVRLNRNEIDDIRTKDPISTSKGWRLPDEIKEQYGWMGLGALKDVEGQGVKTERVLAAFGARGFKFVDRGPIGDFVAARYDAPFTGDLAESRALFREISIELADVCTIMPIRKRDPMEAIGFDLSSLGATAT